APQVNEPAEALNLRNRQVLARNRQQSVGRANVVIDVGRVHEQPGAALQVGCLDRHDAFSANSRAGEVEIAGGDIDAPGRVGGQYAAGSDSVEERLVAGVVRRYHAVRKALIVDQRWREWRVGRNGRGQEGARRIDVHVIGHRALRAGVQVGDAGQIRRGRQLI